MTKDHFLIALSESPQTDFVRVDFAAQPIPQKTFSSIWALESEVNNGGFSQYFLNYSAETSCFVAEALDLIGAPKTADICRRAIAVAFPEGLPSAPEVISTLAERFSGEVLERLGALNIEFFGYPDDLTKLLFEYVSRHPEEFGSVPEAF